MLLKVSETAERFNVSQTAVRNWLRNGLRYEISKEIGRKRYALINPEDVVNYHKAMGREVI